VKKKKTGLAGSGVGGKNGEDIVWGNHLHHRHKLRTKVCLVGWRRTKAGADASSKGEEMRGSHRPLHQEMKGNFRVQPLKVGGAPNVVDEDRNVRFRYILLSKRQSLPSARNEWEGAAWKRGVEDPCKNETQKSSTTGDSCTQGPEKEKDGGAAGQGESRISRDRTRAPLCRSVHDERYSRPGVDTRRL